ncbi:MAG: TRAP transporter substrate-binding protein [Lachnospiraceae bacterium]|jgi:tripartite ATP-independent transporter DctP family solute receptor|nr:TRAP transporter substrate-binding protein [Lachnospiraceae bacterium]
MSRKRGILASLVIGFVSILLCACAGSEPRSITYNMCLGTSSPDDTVTGVFAEKFANEVKTLSGGKMTIKIYSNSTIGNDTELLESCRDGDIPFVIQNTAPETSFMPKLSVFDIPCSFSNIEEARKAIDNPIFYKKIENIYKSGDYKLLGMSDQGFRVMSTNKKIEKFSDFKGQKIRTMENSYHLAFWKSLGANPTPMAFSEVYIGLQQHTIDAEENPLEVIVSGKLYEQQKYIIQTNHLPHYISLIMSETFYNKLSSDEQEICKKAAKIAVEYSRQEADKRNQEKINYLEDNGTEVIPVSSKLHNEMEEASQGVYKNICKKAGKSLVNEYIGK